VTEEREELALLLESCRDDAIDENGARRLAGALQTRTEAAEQVLAEIEFTGLLAQALDDRDDMAFLRSFFERSSSAYPVADVQKGQESRTIKTRLGDEPPADETEDEMTTS